MSYRSPLGAVRGLGSAKSGTGHWWQQRLTALAMIPLVIWFIASILNLLVSGADHGVVTAWIGQPLVAVLLILMLGTGFYHMRLGLQVVIEDYVHHEGIKLASLVAVTFGAIVLASVTIMSVLQISLGA